MTHVSCAVMVWWTRSEMLTTLSHTHLSTSEKAVFTYCVYKMVLNKTMTEKCLLVFFVGMQQESYLKFKYLLKEASIECDQECFKCFAFTHLSEHFLMTCSLNCCTVFLAYKRNLNLSNFTSSCFPILILTFH